MAWIDAFGREWPYNPAQLTRALRRLYALRGVGFEGVTASAEGVITPPPPESIAADVTALLAAHNAQGDDIVLERARGRIADIDFQQALNQAESIVADANAISNLAQARNVVQRQAVLIQNLIEVALALVVLVDDIDKDAP